jgi:hypothetical protein
MAELLAEEKHRQYGIAKHTDVDHNQAPGGGADSLDLTVTMDTPIKVE